MTVTKEEIDARFTYHPPLNQGQKFRYEDIRKLGRNFAEYLVVNCPDSRELSLALTKIEEAIMWANASIARREKE